ncbi:hypothetical protein MPL1_06809 [Methylophaga lonarensis MPL]|uniref:Uncharacterized protein n=1 Tax=Methylophaga lonarensis MPL TaxID=1286106 RepID=M7PGS6_9GAMM|nr:hypothetical protein [Methylophaga lonarensis]EMR13100.1 hypothetical protein MPL1_06809 [Methylophaga lonarensis MPL]
MNLAEVANGLIASRLSLAFIVTSTIKKVIFREVIPIRTDRQELDRHGLRPRDDGLSWRCDRWKKQVSQKSVIASIAKQSSADRKGRSWIATACGLAMTV